MERSRETGKQKPRRGRKNRAAIKGGKLKEHQTTKTMMSSIMKDVPVALQYQERKHGKKISTENHTEEDFSSSKPAQQSSPSALLTLNKKDQIKTPVTSTIKARKTSQHTVAVENSSAKSLKVRNEQHQRSDSEEQCFPETSLNTEASSAADDRTQRNIRGVPVTPQKRKRRAKDASKHEKKTSKDVNTCIDDGSSIYLPPQPSSPPSLLLTSNEKDQTKKPVHSIIEGLRIPEHKVEVELKECNEQHQHGDSEEQCCSEIRLNTEPSSVADEIAQRNLKDVQNQQITPLSGEEDPYSSSLQTSESPSKRHSEKRPLCSELPDQQTFTQSNGKRQKISDNRPLQNVVAEADLCSESNLEGNEDDRQLRLKFMSEDMKEKRFLLCDSPDKFDQRPEDQKSTAKTTTLGHMVDQPFVVHTSWEGHAAEEIKNIADASTKDLNKDNICRTALKVTDYLSYVKIIYVLLEWHKQNKQNRQDIRIRVGIFTVLMRSSDLYCCPIKQDEKEIRFHDKNLSYATLKTSKEFSKKYSQTIWNFIMGYHDKVSSSVKTPQDAIAVCAILFSEVIRYPDMFFHNILLMQFFKSWTEFCDHHPMITGGSWKCQGENKNTSKKENLQPRNSVPDKVKKRKQKNIVFCAKKIMRDEDKMNTLFQIEVLDSQVEEADDTASFETLGYGC
ncbi:uncharacterized protein si:dkey-211g8.8 [Xyrauchen texanus]|uniref:uncharacterized protein si:dkey-211g8.8 n=1 Tax=Xyrauchen texanus TaxID=154827 RepID=UPI002241FD1A|nr:uncharacterized protein si:dkey-211g8.8 [Xyrauchen texanus]